MKAFEHGGNIHKAIRDAEGMDKVLDFSANINPLGPPEWMRPLLSSQLEHLIHYPDPEYKSLVQAVAEHTGIDAEHVIVANGTTELLYTLMRVVSSTRVLIPVPSYVDYVRAAKIAGKSIETIVLREENDFELDLAELSAQILPGDLVVLATPNNPTGKSITRNTILELAAEFPESLFLVDEAFLDFIENCQTVGGVAANVLTMNSMTKFYGVPGLRIGYGILPVELAATVRENLPPWTVNSLAQEFAVRGLQDLDYQRLSRKNCDQLRISLIAELSKVKFLKIYDSSVNYLFIKMLSGSTEALESFCRARGILIRKCDNYQGLSEPGLFFRIAVRTREENQRIVAAINSYFKIATTGKKSKKDDRARSIMFQGTCSDAGKSILTAGLCRILFQDGVKVAPFKSQNMSLNSFVTRQGDEMGRAQVVQAQAAKLDPDCRMNPVLLKPNSDTGSQVIVSGKPVGNMSVLEYNEYKPEVWTSVCKSYDSLAHDYDVVVLEGAGSPGEVNLKGDDIVNMKMAEYAQSPVILVGDIDRGGVYASFVGIMEVLSEWERNLIAGFLVNKFRGQASLLESAHEYVKLHTGRNVMGVVPYIKGLGLPEEDSVSFKKGSFNKSSTEKGIEIALINLPHISNFTDVEAFLEEPDVSLRIIEKIEDLQNPQAIILPGSKNVIHDLQFLKEGGFFDALRRCHKNGAEIIGICGGYQMLGTSIEDPYHIESGLGQIEGLGMLNMATIIEKEKNLTRKEGRHHLSGKKIYGYEIHHGISSVGQSPVMVFDDDTTCGTADEEGRVWGSYLHGVFDSDSFRRWFIDSLRLRTGLQPIGKIVAPYDLEIAFDRLADCVRESLDMDEVYRLLGV
ncbi:MAG: cobyric acid synthase [Desulfobulbaceae bacterium]|nr:cobyric acid synthase [Desulfobulbaceae bacterium]